jgi:transmembrane sensor
MAETRIWELLVKHFNKEISEDEVRELHALLQDRQEPVPYLELLDDLLSMPYKPGSEEKNRKESSLSAILKAIRPDQDTIAAGDPEVNHGTPPGLFAEVVNEGQDGQVIEPAGRMHRRTWLLSAAVLCLALIGGYFFFREEWRNSVNAPLQFQTIVTRAGSKTLINLQDSSTVILNSACRFAYNKDFGAGKREMQLSGEAYFDIHKNPGTPLIIHAGNVIIKVLGTTFNVRANPGDSFVEATLLKGSIEVSLISDPERRILLRPNEKIVIRRNDTVGAVKGPGIADNGPGAGSKASADDVITVTRVEENPADSSCLETIWTRDKMLFRKEPFGTLARKMERWYNVKMMLDPSLNELLFTGSLEKETLQEALQALQHSADFHYRIDGRLVIITK